MNNSYSAMKERHRAEINAFPLGMAFSDEQVKEMFEELGVTSGAELVGLGAGVYIRKTDVAAWEEMTERHAKEHTAAIESSKGDTTPGSYLFDAIREKLGDHKYAISYDPYAALYSLGLTMAEIESDTAMLKTYNAACVAYMRDFKEANC